MGADPSKKMGEGKLGRLTGKVTRYFDEHQGRLRGAAGQTPPGRPSRPTPRPAAASASAATLIAAMATAKAYR